MVPIDNKMATSNALAAIERILEGKTTLKTQRVTHTNIICKACIPSLVLLSHI